MSNKARVNAVALLSLFDQGIGIVRAENFRTLYRKPGCTLAQGQ